jgi:NADH:ubiquinone oxidoreductase subunit 5 (subunit L)/multisubunit Na+/H+ antiporter MnhA subunit
MVHIYTIGYMEEDPGYQRFFSYISAVHVQRCSCW